MYYIVEKFIGKKVGTGGFHEQIGCGIVAYSDYDHWHFQKYPLCKVKHYERQIFVRHYKSGLNKVDQHRFELAWQRLEAIAIEMNDGKRYKRDNELRKIAEA